MSKSTFLLGVSLALWVLVACSLSPRHVVSASNGPTVPLVTEWSHSPIRGELIESNAVDLVLIAFAVNDAKLTLGKSIAFYKALRADDGTIRYIFEIERTDDSFLVYEKSSSSNKFSKKYLHNQLRL